MSRGKVALVVLGSMTGPAVVIARRRGRESEDFRRS